MSFLSNKSIKEFQEIFKKEYGKEMTFEEARDAGERLVGLYKILFDAHVEDLKRKEKLKEFPKGYSLMDGKTYNCGICGNSIKDEQLWYDKWGSKCLACQDAVNKRKVPGKVCYNDKIWYAPYEFDIYFKIKTPTVKKLAREGVLKARIVPKSGFQVFLIEENADALPPKDVVKHVSMPIEGKENAFCITPWYEVKDPEKTLKNYKIWPYVKVLEQATEKA